MVVLGIFIGPELMAASVARDGEVLAAQVCWQGAEGVLISLAQQCLQQAQLAEADVDEVVFSDGYRTDGSDHLASRCRETLTAKFSRAPLTAVAPDRAHLGLLRSLPETDRAILALPGTGGGGTVGLLRNRQIVASTTIEGYGALEWLAATAADALGRERGDPIAFLEHASGGADGIPGGVPLVSSTGPWVIDCDRNQLLLEIASHRDTLSHGPRHIGAAHARQRLATTVLDSIADALASLAREWTRETGISTATLVGGLVAAPEFRSRVRRRIDRIEWLANPSDVLAAVGASLGPFEATARLESTALGPSFDEQAIKRVIENCRLDCVYEPRWSRLLESVSRLLSGGALVAWFQGRADFGETSFGSRSVLADPTSPYVRDNVNVFLLGRPAHAPLSVVTASALARSRPIDAFPQEEQIVPSADWATHVRNTLDKRGSVRVVTGPLSSSLQDLLEAHSRRSGVAALVNVPLAGQASPLANDPRSAIQSLFGSAADCLVIGRFIVAKNYRLLLSRTH